MVTLPPYESNRAWLRSFWLVVSAVLGLACGGLLAFGGHAHGVAVGAVVAVALALPGLTWPRSTSKAFRAWNRLARLFAAAARAYVARVCLYTVFPAVGRLESRMEMELPVSPASGWKPRQAPQTTNYLSPSDLGPPNRRERAWLRAYVAWARRSGNLWTLGLLPFLLLLALLEEDVGASQPSHGIYTLY